MNKSTSIGPHKVITMQYSLSNSDGVVVREATGSPITYLHGANALFPKLEQALESHHIGDIVTTRLLPDDTFGKRDTDLIQEVSLDEFPPGEDIRVGGEVTGTDSEGEEVTFSVIEIRNGKARLDGNHPFAGQSLVFEVEIQDIRDATDEEIRQGKVIG